MARLGMLKKEVIKSGEWESSSEIEQMLERMESILMDEMNPFEMRR